jgi:hypothetical protein
MLFRTNQETGPAIDLFRQAPLASIGQWCGPFARLEFINHSLKTDVESLASHEQCRAFFARSAVGDDQHLRQMFFPKVYSYAGRVEDPISANGTPSIEGKEASYTGISVSLEPASVTFNWLNLQEVSQSCPG